MANPNVIYARTKEWQNAWHIAALSGTIEVRTQYTTTTAMMYDTPSAINLVTLAYALLE